MTFSTRPSRLIQYFGADGRMTVDGLDFFDRLADESFGGSVPIGGIIDWSGSVADIPDRWALCDGTNGTPNLTGRFVIHADADSGGSYDVGDTGGAATVALSTAQLPAHGHGSGSLAFTGVAVPNHAHGHSFELATNSQTTGGANRVTNILDGNNGSFDRTTTGAGGHTPSGTISGSTANAGSGSSHENMPPYYALAKIMRLR